MLFCLLLLAPVVLWVYYSFVEQHLTVIQWVLVFVEPVISSIGIIVSVLRRVNQLSSWIANFGYFGGIGGGLATLAMTYIGHRYADKCQAGIEQAERVYKTLSKFWKKVSPAFTSVTDALSKWYKQIFVCVIVLGIGFLLAGVGALTYTFVFVTPYIVCPPVMIGCLICLKFSNFFDSWNKTKELKAEYEKQLLAEFKRQEFPAQQDWKDMFFLNLINTDNKYSAYKQALILGPTDQKSNFARVVAFFACLKPLVYVCLALVLVAYASPDLPNFDVKDDVPFHVDIDKCWKHFRITDDDIANIDKSAPRRGWVHSYQACYDCASRHSNKTDGTIWTNESAYFGCAQKLAVELNSTHHDNIQAHTDKPKLDWLQRLQNDFCSVKGGKWMCNSSTDTSDTPDPLIEFTKDKVESLKRMIGQVKQECTRDYVGKMKARAESFLWHISYFVCFVVLWHALAYITLLV